MTWLTCCLPYSASYLQPSVNNRSSTGISCAMAGGYVHILWMTFTGTDGVHAIDLDCRHFLSMRSYLYFGHNELTYPAIVVSHCGCSWSMSWVLIPWWLVSPGHQHLCCGLRKTKIGRFLSFMRRDSNFLLANNVMNAMTYVNLYGSGHGTAAVLLPGFAINR